MTLLLWYLLAFSKFPITLSNELPTVESQDRLEGTAMKIAAFNVQIFGANKMRNKMVKEVLVKVILKYDVILIQEIRSRRDTPINSLLASVNRVSSPPGVYKMALSKRLGRTVSKEQYAFLYRTDSVSLQDSYVFDDSVKSQGKDQFQREPFIVRFKGHHTYVSDFAMVGIHTSPSEAVSEIDHLVDVYDDIVRRWKLKDVIILGDFNGGCSYVTKSRWKVIRLATDRRFYWLFSDHVDTTVAKSDCPYDRMVVAGYNMIRGVFAESAKAFHFDKAYNLTQKEAEDVSDHWPIEIQLKDYTFKDEEDYFSESITVTNHDNHIAKVSNRVLFSLRFKRKNPLLSEGFSCTASYSSSGAIREIVIWKVVETLEEARNAINAFRRRYPMLVSESQVSISRREVSKIESYRKVDCTGRDSEKTVYQMLPNNCSGMKSLTIKGVKLVCSRENLSCEIGMTVSLSTYRA
ncbi:Deoxyribonuclease-1 [Acropora cervicornis]|uniref:Deoxyribonuclease-1 n=1 Tax=Acropora cervicornis TaxID=6130 RepID=A0AAD9PSC1_ACRCE|nr:Deoxyribonuclease-1 [Acropora cervicornis]